MDPRPPFSERVIPKIKIMTDEKVVDVFLVTSIDIFYH